MFAYFGMPGPAEWLLLGLFLVLFTLWRVGRNARKRDGELGRPLSRPIWKITPGLTRTEGSRDAPPWFLPAGVIALMLGVLGFIGSAAVGGGGDVFGSLLAGLLNPLFFVGFPLGIYWLHRYAKRPGRPGKGSPSPAPTPIARPEEPNPRLTHCLDCGRHVSRLAAACPHCGRPLTPERETGPPTTK